MDEMSNLLAVMVMQSLNAFVGWKTMIMQVKFQTVFKALCKINSTGLSYYFMHVIELISCIAHTC